MPPFAALLVGVLSTVPASFPAQGLFETLVIAQASLLAIVVSVSMMSMQVSTNRFAPQLSRLYRESGFDAITARFGFSILLDLMLFALPTPWVGRTPVRAIVVGLVVGVASWAFVALLDIEDRLLVFLNPDPVLSSLVDSVSFERYHDFSVERREEGRIARNPILEIVQMAQTSLEQRDNYSALRAVDALDEATERLLTGYAALSPDRRRETAPDIHKLFDYWNQVADLAVERGADDVLHAIVDAEEAIGREAIDLDLSAAATGSVDAVFHFCAVTLATNRLEARYHATLGELLSASLEAGALAVAEGAVTDLARLSKLVDRREDDLLVADDDRIAPHEEFFDNWAHFLRVHHERLETDQCRSLYAHFENEYRSIREEPIPDDRVDTLTRAAGPGFRDLGVAAAGADVQWVVSRTTEQLLELAVLAERPREASVRDAERIVEAGGCDGVRDAIRRLRARREAGADSPDTDQSWHVPDPLADRLAGGDGPNRSGHGRPVRAGSLSDEFDRLLDEIDDAVSEPTGRE
ncbi:hypothetical protein SAMN05443636_1621 [Halobaculum gomorrense]|uniref:DUF2254 domain-containing protein n=1 Tax=Halobaculum gomorrense TaxID=43928 RepID=A0A1M5PIJ8_9EURY|nr:hypothetical protein SAMN05443636_1621 [Halobaculum gomorrense]